MRRLAAALTVVVVAGCGGGSAGHKAQTSSSTSTAAGPAASQTVSATNTTPAPAVRLSHTLRLTSAAFRPNAAIPKLYTCDGKDLSLPVSWTGVPKGTRELVLVMRDPDAPGGSFVHWAVAAIAPLATGIAAGAPPPAGAVQGTNSFGTTGYRGPCPPSGDKPHHYVLTLSALSGPSHLGPGFNPDQLHTAALALATLVGTYKRS